MKARKPLVVLLLAILTALTVLGCGRTSSGGAASGTTGGGGAPTEGGTLRLASAGDLDPPTFFTGNGTQSLVTGTVYDTLIRYPATGLEAKPSLATSWHLANDGKTLTIELRKGVKYQNGEPFTSKDVQFSIEQYADPKRAAQFLATAAAVVGFDTSKADEIVLTLAHPTSNIMDLLSVVPMLEPKSIDEFDTGKKLIGTGPFEFVSWTPNSRIVLKANKSYWGGAPHLEGVEVDVVNNPQTQVSELRSGQIDGALAATYVELQSLEASGQYQVKKLEGADRSLYLGANVENEALKNVDLRQAIAYAVDRERIAKDVYRGYATPVNLPWPTYSPAYSASENRTYPLDPTKAEQLLKTVGQVPSIPLAYPGESPVVATTAEILQNDLEEVGIPVKLEPLDLAAMIRDTIGGEFPGLWISEASFFQFTPSTLAITAYPFNAQANTSNFKSPGYQSAAAAAWEAPDPEGPQAKQAYAQINHELLSQVFLVDLVTAPPVIALSQKVQGVSWTKRNELLLADAYLEG